MKVLTLARMGSVALVACFTQVSVAAPQTTNPGPATWLDESMFLVDSAGQTSSQRGGIVNERSTGNEPFMGPGASGGPTHSAPGATENTIKQPSQGTQQGSPSHQNNERQAFQRLESDPAVQGQDLVNQQREKRQ